MSREALAFPAANAPRMIWVFALDIDPSGIDRWDHATRNGDWPLPGVLGVHDLDPADVEVFREEAIAEYGLVRYLTDANGMSVESVAEDAATLSALPGVIVLIHSKGLAGREGHFDPAHPARFVGRYSDAATLAVSVPRPVSTATRGIVAGGETPGRKSGLTFRVILLIAVIVTLALFLVIWGSL